jgi:hypothetical protein
VRLGTSAAEDPAPAAVRFTMTTAEAGRSTRVVISAHDTMFDAPPFTIESFTVRVCGRRPRRDAMDYFAETITELARELAARPRRKPDTAELEQLLIPRATLEADALGRPELRGLAAALTVDPADMDPLPFGDQVPPVAPDVTGLTGS